MAKAVTFKTIVASVACVVAFFVVGVIMDSINSFWSSSLGITVIVVCLVLLVGFVHVVVIPKIIYPLRTKLRDKLNKKTPDGGDGD